MTISSSNDTYYKYAEASLLGAGRGLLGLPVEHPFDVVKTCYQANPEASSVLSVTKEIYKKNGVKGFYSGAIPNAMRLAGKQMYRWPMMLGFPPFFKETLPKDFQKQYPSSVKVATGLTIASLETFVICPLERLKVYLMTNDAKTQKITLFFREHRGKLLPELSRGLNVMYVRQMASWVSFLVADEKFKNWEKERTGQSQLSLGSLVKVSFLVGLVNTAANMPFDMVKTNLQKNDHMLNEGLIKTMTKIYQKYGIKGLYAGWQVRMTQYMIQSVFTVSLLDKLENSWRHK